MPNMNSNYVQGVPRMTAERIAHPERVSLKRAPSVYSPGFVIITPCKL